MVEHLTLTQKVAGLSPAVPAIGVDYGKADAAYSTVLRIDTDGLTLQEVVMATVDIEELTKRLAALQTAQQLERLKLLDAATRALWGMAFPGDTENWRPRKLRELTVLTDDQRALLEENKHTVMQELIDAR